MISSFIEKYLNGAEINPLIREKISELFLNERIVDISVASPELVAIIVRGFCDWSIETYEIHALELRDGKVLHGMVEKKFDGTYGWNPDFSDLKKIGPNSFRSRVGQITWVRYDHFNLLTVSTVVRVFDYKKDDLYKNHGFFSFVIRF